MRLSLGLFSQFCLILILGLTIVYYKSENYFERQQLLADMPKDNSDVIEKKEFELRVVRAQMEEVKAETLALLEKEAPLPSNSLVLQNLRSQLRSPASVPEIDMSLLEAEKIKKAFRDKNYFQVTSLAETFLNKNSQSSLIPEITFFASESYFLNHQYDKAINSIEKMTSQFPEHIMTGYALLRLGQISEKADQNAEAISIYKIIQNQFKDKGLVDEATQRISRLEE
jgi:TolA-binding protein